MRQTISLHTQQSLMERRRQMEEVGERQRVQFLTPTRLVPVQGCSSARTLKGTIFPSMEPLEIIRTNIGTIQLFSLPISTWLLEEATNAALFHSRDLIKA